MSTAKVIMWNSEKGFGFCVRDEDKKKLFFHASVIKNRYHYSRDELVGQTLELKSVNEKYIKGARVEDALIRYDEALLGEALILAISKPRSHNHIFEEKFSIYLDGDRLLSTTEENVISATEIKFKLPCKRKARKQAVADIRLEKGCTYITLFNPHNTNGKTKPVEMSNLVQLYEYGDFYGGKWAGLFKVMNPSNEWELKLEIPEGRYTTKVETYKGKGVNLYEES